jgi:hypothetical protein
MFRLPCVTAPSWVSVRLAVVHSSRVFPSPFEGCGVEEGRERVAQCRGMTPATPHSTRTVSGMATQLQAVRTASGPEFQAVLGDRRGEDSSFDPGARGVSGHIMLQSGRVGEVSRVEGKPRARRRLAEGSKPSSEEETRSRGRDPRARRRSTCGVCALKCCGQVGLPGRSWAVVGCGPALSCS